MYSTPTLATRFARNTFVARSETPLAEDQMRRAAPSIFAAGKHGSRSERYTYIPTIDVLRGLKREGFEPFMVAQGKTRIEGKTEFTKHMVRLRHAGQVTTRPEANEIILINSHDGASSYQMLAGAFRLWPAGHRRNAPVTTWRRAAAAAAPGAPSGGAGRTSIALFNAPTPGPASRRAQPALPAARGRPRRADRPGP